MQLALEERIGEGDENNLAALARRLHPGATLQLETRTAGWAHVALRSALDVPTPRRSIHSVGARSRPTASCAVFIQNATRVLRSWNTGTRSVLRRGRRPGDLGGLQCKGFAALGCDVSVN